MNHEDGMIGGGQVILLRRCGRRKAAASTSYIRVQNIIDQVNLCAQGSFPLLSPGQGGSGRAVDGKELLR